MKAIVAWWKLDNSNQSIETLRSYLKNEGVDPWEKIKGLRLKFWISEPENNLWGAVMIWESDADMQQVLPPNNAMKLIGYPPTVRYAFDIEATIEGDFIYKMMNKLGLAYQNIKI